MKKQILFMLLILSLLSVAYAKLIRTFKVVNIPQVIAVQEHTNTNYNVKATFVVPRVSQNSIKVIKHLGSIEVYIKDPNGNYITGEVVRVEVGN